MSGGLYLLALYDRIIVLLTQHAKIHCIESHSLSASRTLGFKRITNLRLC